MLFEYLLEHKSMSWQGCPAPQELEHDLVKTPTHLLRLLKPQFAPATTTV